MPTPAATTIPNWGRWYESRPSHCLHQPTENVAIESRWHRRQPRPCRRWGTRYDRTDGSRQFGKCCIHSTPDSVLSSLFDTGSPISFIRHNAVSLTSTGLRGLGGVELLTHGVIDCLIRFDGRCGQIKLTVVPNESMLLPCVLERDFLSAFQDR